MSLTDEVRADFVARFTEFWRAPDPAALPTMLTDDVHLEAPTTTPTDGLADGTKVFEGLFALIPDLHADVHRWGGHPGGVFIEFTLLGTVGTTAVAVRAIDDILLRADGLATERVSYFDPAPFLAALAPPS